MQNIDAFTTEKPKRIALLLPLTGGAAELGNAVRDGFMTQMFDSLDRKSKVELHIYNTNANTMDMLYQKVQKDEADMIVGPLLKDSVQELISANDAQLPVLSLNIPENMNVDTNNVCFYSLSPEQEAEQTAQRIFDEGKQHPVIFSVRKTVNRRMADAFAKKWAELTAGEIVEIEDFSDVTELQKKIPQVFNKETIAKLEESLNTAENRKKKLPKAEREQAIKDAKEASKELPDVVYLLGQQSDLILMKPFIEVAANPAITNVEFYTSSHSFEKSGEKYAELNGLVFSAMPLFVGTVSASVPEEDRRLNIYNTQLSRLYAMGKDAYRISNNLVSLKSDENYSFMGLTGSLSADERCVIQRELTWVRYTKNGIETILTAPKEQTDTESNAGSEKE